MADELFELRTRETASRGMQPHCGTIESFPSVGLGNPSSARCIEMETDQVIVVVAVNCKGNARAAQLRIHSIPQLGSGFLGNGKSSIVANVQKPDGGNGPRFCTKGRKRDFVQEPRQS